MRNYSIKQIENIVTKVGVYLLVFMTLIGILFVFDSAYDLDIFPSSRGKQVFGIMCAIILVLICSCVMVATMLNISRIANAVESISENITNDKSFNDSQDIR